MNEGENGQHNCIDVRYVRDNTTVTGAVCVALNKNIGRKERKVDIIFMEDRGAWSVRSVTELMNILMKWEVPLDERKRIFDFVAERLRVIAADESMA